MNKAIQLLFFSMIVLSSTRSSYLTPCLIDPFTKSNTELPVFNYVTKEFENHRLSPMELYDVAVTHGGHAMFAQIPYKSLPHNFICPLAVLHDSDELDFENASYFRAYKLENNEELLFDNVTGRIKESLKKNANPSSIGLNYLFPHLLQQQTPLNLQEIAIPNYLLEQLNILQERAFQNGFENGIIATYHQIISNQENTTTTPETPLEESKLYHQTNLDSSMLLTKPSQESHNDTDSSTDKVCDSNEVEQTKSLPLTPEQRSARKAAKKARLAAQRAAEIEASKKMPPEAKALPLELQKETELPDQTKSNLNTEIKITEKDLSKEPLLPEAVPSLIHEDTKKPSPINDDIKTMVPHQTETQTLNAPAKKKKEKKKKENGDNFDELLSSSQDATKSLSELITSYHKLCSQYDTTIEKSSRKSPEWLIEQLDKLLTCSLEIFEHLKDSDNPKDLELLFNIINMLNTHSFSRAQPEKLPYSCAFGTVNSFMSLYILNKWKSSKDILVKPKVINTIKKWCQYSSFNEVFLTEKEFNQKSWAIVHPDKKNPYTAENISSEEKIIREYVKKIEHLSLEFIPHVIHIIEEALQQYSTLNNENPEKKEKSNSLKDTIYRCLKTTYTLFDYAEHVNTQATQQYRDQLTSLLKEYNPEFEIPSSNTSVQSSLLGNVLLQASDVHNEADKITLFSTMYALRLTTVPIYKFLSDVIDEKYGILKDMIEYSSSSILPTLTWGLLCLPEMNNIKKMVQDKIYKSYPNSLERKIVEQLFKKLDQDTQRLKDS